ncbi:MAG: hypothetical protein HY775_03450 [Acidobacteria bacterium]|nr:hypothetical protein [Acidobacteriota bacterium]
MDERLDELLERLEEDLEARAYLFDYPVAYREGVETAITAVRALLSSAAVAA